MAIDSEPKTKIFEKVEIFHDGVGMVFDKIPLLKGQNANAILVEKGKRFSLKNPRSEVEIPDILT